MAEIIIPVVALAGAAVLSSMDKKKQQNNNINSYNNFINQNKSHDINNADKLQSANTIFRNPLEGTSIEGFSGINSSNSDNCKEYPKPRNIKEFDKVDPIDNTQQLTGRSDNGFISLTGDKVHLSDLKHKNMQHFYKSKNQGPNPNNAIDAILDNMQGSGTQHFKKDEIAPLFRPEENMSWNNGTPNNTDFFQSRMNAPMSMNNVTLWDQKMVGPGLNLGYSTDGTGGFNSGLNGRDLHLPRTVNELRADNNQRETFEFTGPQGPAQSDVKNPGFLGRVEKKLPDPTFTVGPDRWFTTTGSEIRPTNRSEIQISEENRGLKATDYFGGGNNQGVESTYAQPNFRETNRQQLNSLPISNVNAGDRFEPAKNNFGVDGFKVMANNRCTTQHTIPVGGISGVVNSIMAPINDMLRPSRKENVVGNIRIMGSINNKEGQGGYVMDKNNRTRTTIRDMTGNRIGLNHLNVQNQSTDGYISSNMVPIENQRDTTSVSYSGGGNSQTSAMRNIDVKQLRVNNNNKSFKSRPNVGNNTQFLGSINAQTCRDENIHNNNRMWVPSNMPASIPSVNTMGNTQPLSFTQSESRDNRLDDSLLTAFKNNPYTQSLNSVVQNIQR